MKHFFLRHSHRISLNFMHRKHFRNLYKKNLILINIGPMFILSCRVQYSRRSFKQFALKSIYTYLVYQIVSMTDEAGILLVKKANSASSTRGVISPFSYLKFPSNFIDNQIWSFKSFIQLLNLWNIYMNKGLSPPCHENGRIKATIPTT